MRAGYLTFLLAFLRNWALKGLISSMNKFHFYATLLIILVWKSVKQSFQKLHLLEYLLFWGQSWQLLSAEPHVSCRVRMLGTAKFVVDILVIPKIILIWYSSSAGFEGVGTVGEGAVGVKEEEVILPPRHVAIRAVVSTNIDILNLEQRKVARLQCQFLSFSVRWILNFVGIHWLRLYGPRICLKSYVSFAYSWTSTSETILLGIT